MPLASMSGHPTHSASFGYTKTATALFFESGGGQARQEATVPELRLAVDWRAPCACSPR
jgi:hypothetical protein